MSADESLDQTTGSNTGVVNYFLAAGEFEVLTALCGSVVVPRAVFDPDEPDDGREESMSELRRGWHLHRRRATGREFGPDMKAKSSAILPHFDRLSDLAQQQLLVAIDLSDDELVLYAQLRDRVRMRDLGLTVGLGHGEAAVLAVCSSRSLRPATDDSDAVKAAAAILPGVTPLRIRALLALAVARGVMTEGEAMEAHKRMKSFGFWDKDDLTF
jgi:predicted nucleic acid-binding protein